MIMYAHHKPGLGEDPGETFESMFLHSCIAMGHGDGGTRTRPRLPREAPTTKTVATLDLEFRVAPIDHHVLRGEEIAASVIVYPGRRAIAGYCRPCPGRNAHRGRT